MALRRLLSGWLIAVAALARSMALALERAAAGRPEPILVADPVMAALLERYPGAPAHWLEHVAERTTDLAEIGAAPVSVSSQADAWSPSLATLPAPSPAEVAAADPALPLAPETVETFERPPLQPVARPVKARSRAGEAAPSLEALRERSSEVWRRPDMERGRRSRPVFAPVEPVAQRVKAVEPPATSEPQPRSPLVFSDRPRAVPATQAPSLAAASTAEAPAVDRVWSEPPPRMTAPAPPALESAERPDAISSQSYETGARRPMSRPVFTAGPAPAPRPTEVIEPSIVDGSSRRTSFSADQPVATEPRVTTPTFSSPAKPARRRSIFRGLGGFVTKVAARIFGRAPEVKARSTSSVTSGESIASTLPSDPRTTTDVRSLASDQGRARPEPHFTASPAVRPPRGDWGEAFANDEAPSRKRARFMVDRAASRAVRRPFAAQSPADDRWPDFPASVFATPRLAETPPPRLDQLAREQEEGRWSV